MVLCNSYVKFTISDSELKQTKPGKHMFLMYPTDVNLWVVEFMKEYIEVNAPIPYQGTKFICYVY